jgi:hypothetical protein
MRSHSTLSTLTIQHFTYNWYNTFITHVRSLITVEVLLFNKSQFTTYAEDTRHLNQCTRTLLITDCRTVSKVPRRWRMVWHAVPDKQCTYKHNTEAYLCNLFCRGKARSITYSVCVPVALVMQHEMRMCRMVLSCVAVWLRYFPTLEWSRFSEIVIELVSYSWGYGFETCIGDHLFGLIILVHFLRIYTEILGHRPDSLVHILTYSQFITIFTFEITTKRVLWVWQRERERERERESRHVSLYSNWCRPLYNAQARAKAGLAGLTTADRAAWLVAMQQSTVYPIYTL